jgi:hypothetical protein
VVLAAITPYIYKVKGKGVEWTTNHDRLKICRDKPSTLPVWLTKFLAGQRLAAHSANAGTPAETDATQVLYCLCRRPYLGEFMIMCDDCTEWFHGACVNVAEADCAPEMTYLCPWCRSPAPNPEV